jgi:glycosyltransferase involved in cell wall biosynthesis
MKTSDIIHVSGYYPPHLGGQEIAVQDLVAQLALMGMKVEVVTSDLGASTGAGIEDGIRVTRLRSVEFGHTAITWSLFFWLLRHAKRDTIVHLHFGQFFDSEIVWLASKIKRFRYIMHIHCHPVRSGPVGKLLPLYKMLFFGRELRAAEAVIVLNSQHRHIVRFDYGYNGRLLVMSNGVDESFFRATGSPVERELRKVLFVGRLSPGKNADTLLEALAIIKCDITLDIIGDGECRPRLEAIIKDKKLKNVKLHGRLSRDEIRGFYDTSSALILPSSFEAQPMVLLEAMASRIPIIVTKGIGVELGAREAILIEPTIQGIANGIENFFAMPPDARKLLSDAAFEKVEQRRWGTLIDSYIQLYEEIARSLR